jgi:hypothetical protein
MVKPISNLFLLQIIVSLVFIDSFIISTKKDKLMLPSSNIIHKTSSSSSWPSSSVQRLLLEERDTTSDQIGKGIIDYQSNTNQFGRGEQHLSAVLYEGDTVIYRTGNWYVDGVLVGDGDIQYKICRIETIQIVWTHNCEHGVLRGLDINTTTTTTSRIENENDNDLEEISSSSSSSSTESTTAATSSASASSDDTNKGLRFLIPTPFVDVEFGPEQLVGRINTIEWIKTTDGSGRNEEEEEGISSIPLQENMWIGKDEML